MAFYLICVCAASMAAPWLRASLPACACVSRAAGRGMAGGPAGGSICCILNFIFILFFVGCWCKIVKDFRTRTHLEEMGEGPCEGPAGRRVGRR